MVEMKSIRFMICLLIMAMDMVAGILGIEAELAQNKAKHLKMFMLECRDPSQQAFKLGLAAAIMLAVAHTIANLLGGCVCVRSTKELNQSSPNKQLAVASLVFAWIVVAVAFSMLVVGAVANSERRSSCGTGHHRFLSIGGILCFLHGLFTVAYYVSASAAAREENTRQHGSAV